LSLSRRDKTQTVAQSLTQLFWLLLILSVATEV